LRNDDVSFVQAVANVLSAVVARAREEELEAQLQQARRLESVGKLAGGIAHDFNNLLAIIRGYADFAREAATDDEQRSDLEELSKAAGRGAVLVRQLLLFSRRKTVDAVPVDLAEIVRDTEPMLRRTLGEHIDLRCKVRSELPPAMMDPGQVTQVLVNLAVNARDAMPEGGTLTIRARNHGGEISGKGISYVVIDIIDNGMGMSDEVQARAFEPFFTTKDIGRGSGLGLSQAYGFAKQSGGALTLESVPGQGTKVSLHLPEALDSVRRPAGDQPATRPRDAGSATVLLVEDDAGVAELALGLLENAGYKVKTAGNAAEALKVLRNGEPIDLVFSDIMMPGGMNGAELARIVRGEFPSIFILLATGYAEAAAQAATQEFPLIRKPYGREVLLDKVGEILGEVI
jgi:nitrogen-specific signal transduction histidine kinase/CheY-like chemotaxis protein